MPFKKRRQHRVVWGVTVITILAAYCVWTIARPLPMLRPVKAVAKLQAPAGLNSLSWPAAGQSAAGIVGTTILNTNNDSKPLPTASTAKVLTALSVLSQKPLQLGELGAMITITQSDVDRYNFYAAQDGSVVPVVAGEQISEYQMLQAMMLPSANNMADSLAIWAFGSLANYTSFANQYAHQLSMTNTHVGIDASGFDPSTTATAHDLVRLGETAMQNPVLAQIVGQTSATDIPETTIVHNVNFLLGSDNIIGVKTGNTDQAGGVFISASKAQVNNSPVTIVTAVSGAANLSTALQTSRPLISSAQSNFSTVSISQSGAVVGNYPLPWGGTIAAITNRNLGVAAWKGSTLTATISLQSTSANSKSGHTVGTLNTAKSLFAPAQSIPVSLSHDITKPPLWWRLSHPY